MSDEEESSNLVHVVVTPPIQLWLPPTNEHLCLAIVDRQNEACGLVCDVIGNLAKIIDPSDNPYISETVRATLTALGI